MEEQPNFQPPSPPGGPIFNSQAPQNLPNATAVLVLGILSLIFMCPPISLVGIVLGIVSLVLAARDQFLYTSYPGTYSLSSYNNLKAGRVCAIIGLIISSLIFVIYILFVIGIIATSTMPFWGTIN
jgi:hypothetical protein